MTFTHEFFDLVLGLDDNWQVESVEANYVSGEVIINVKYIGKKAECPNTKEMCSMYDHAPVRKWRHLDILQYKTYISCRLPRVRNSEGKVVTIEPLWAAKSERHTCLFERAVIDLLQATKNQTRTAKFMHCSFREVNRIIHLSTERGLSRRNFKDLEFAHLSIDEKSFKKGHQYVTVLSHPGSGCVLDIEQDRTKKAVRKLLDRVLTDQQQKKVQTISMDMWKAYLSVSKERLPNASIVHDRFHLVQYLNKAIDQVRRREVRDHEELKHSRYALLKNQCNLTEKQRIKFESIRKANYEVSKAWEICANFKDLFNKEDTETKGFILFMNWAQHSLNKGIKEVSKVVNMFKGHLSGVVNALVTNFNNAMAERLNGKIQEVKTTGRGYRTFKNFRSSILFFHGGLDLYPLKR